MSKKEKLEKDYKNFNMNIERDAEEEIKKIREKTNTIKEEASKMGEAVELSLMKKKRRQPRKKLIPRACVVVLLELG